MASSISKRNSKIQHNVIETAPKSTLLMLLAGLFILLIEALFLQRLDSPVALSAPFSCLALYIGAALGGGFCAQRLESGAAFGCSLISSSILCALLILARAFMAAPESPNSFAVSLVTHLLIPLSAVLGALICSRLKSKKEIKKRKNHYRSKK